MNRVLLHQQAITDPVSENGLYVFCNVKDFDRDKIYEVLYIIKRLVDGKNILLGLGKDITDLLGANIPGFKVFPSFQHNDISIPATNSSLLLWFRGDDRGKIFHQLLMINDFIKEVFLIDDMVEAFSYGGGADLSGFIDGTANPKGDEVYKVALVESESPKLNGSSFLAIQKWKHDFDALKSMSSPIKEEYIGRSLTDNKKLKSLEMHSHVKRTEQRSFKPEAIIKRSSMPWSDGLEGGLMFAGFSSSFYAFETQLRNMIGLNDNIVDGLFRFSAPLTGSYFWCPPFRTGKLDLSILGI
jgi:putative iron-dependent peroxidase